MKKITALCCFMMFLGGCGGIKNRVEDFVHGWDSCSPVTPACAETPEAFRAIPMIAAQDTWRGRNADELVAAWGLPDSMEKVGDEGVLRYVWVAKRTLAGDTRYEHDHWKNEWTLVRRPDMTYECRTQMLVDANKVVTPAWVDRLGVCQQFFDPRPAYVPPRKPLK